MKINRWLKRLAAMALAGVLSLSVVSCRKENEVILSYQDPAAQNTADATTEIHAGLYLCFLIQADSEARTKVDEAQTSGDTTETVDYHAQKVEDKDFSQWVKERADELAGQYAAVMIQTSEYELSLSDAQKSGATSYADFLWDQYGYSSLYEANGVAKTTYRTYCEYGYYKEALFNYYYGKGGTEEIPEAALKEALETNYVLADTLTCSFKDEEGNELSDAKKAADQAMLEGYAKQLNRGKSFAEVKKSFDAATGTDDTTTETDAKDPYAVLYGGENTSDPSSYYTALAKLKVGEVQVLEFDDCYMLAVRQDVLADSYYLTQSDSALRTLLKNDAMDEKIAEFVKTLKVTTNDSAVEYYAPEKLEYPTSSNGGK